ncbi:MAG: NAD-dependent epimerase [Gemmatimonadaceae bacterium]|nr:NAD-dependent epimerase [Gemmatimonadaceae bacterium]
MQPHTTLVTGAAGFIGFHLARRLLNLGHEVSGIDNLNSYYDVRLKEARLEALLKFPNFKFHNASIEDRGTLDSIFEKVRPDRIVNLAAQAGVRYSIENPAAYIDSNVVGFGNILEGARRLEVEHLVFASSSSVYGANTMMPFSVHDNVDHPLSLYAATKKANELMAHSYSHLYALPTTGLRFFTVYGPWGRPDMALFLFTSAILAGKPINVFNHGDMRRDFTYVDDIIEGVVRVLNAPASPNEQWDSDKPDPGTSRAPYRLFNIGNNTPVQLLDMIAILEARLERKAEINFLPMQAGDVPATAAEVDDLETAVGFRPSTPLETGVGHFVDWYRAYYKVPK